MIPQNAIFLFVLVVAAGFFALNVQRLAAYLNFGVAENRPDHPLTRLKNVLTGLQAAKKAGEAKRTATGRFLSGQCARP